MFLVNSRLSLSFATSSPHTRSVKVLRHPFFRRYGVILPSSLTEGRSITLGYFSLPTSVGLRYGQKAISLEAFLGGVGPSDFRPLAETRCSRHASRNRDLPRLHAPMNTPSLSIRWVHSPYRVPSSLQTISFWCRNLTPACHRLRL
jgi:hypothetical protein